MCDGESQRGGCEITGGVCEKEGRREGIGGVGEGIGRVGEIIQSLKQQAMTKNANLFDHAIDQIMMYVMIIPPNQKSI